MKFSFIDQVEENVCFNLTFPYHIKFEDLLGNDFYNKDYKDAFHCHSFEDVLLKAYREPKAFYLTEDDRKYYSEQEITFIEKIIEDEKKKIENGYEIVTLNLEDEVIDYINEYKFQKNLTFEEAIIDILKEIVKNPDCLKIEKE